jgi:hypothetical protein
MIKSSPSSGFERKNMPETNSITRSLPRVSSDFLLGDVFLRNDVHSFATKTPY